MAWHKTVCRCGKNPHLSTCGSGAKYIKKAPILDRKGAWTSHRRWHVKHEFPFSKEGGAVSGDTRRSYAMRIFPW
jgi:hypothetical protein